MRRAAPLLLSVLYLSSCDSATSPPAAPPEVLYTACDYFTCSLRAIRADGSGERPVTSNGWDGEWSPDGRQIVFASDRDGPRQIYVMQADGSGVRRVTSNPEPEDMPTWSPDGRSIAFVIYDDRGNHLIRQDLDGSHRVVLVAQPTGALYDIDWSPDGRRLVYEDQFTITTVGADGRGLLRLATGEFPVWTPGGDRIVFCDDDRHLASMRPDGTDQRSFGVPQVSRGKEYYPAWSRSGDRIAFMRYQSGSSTLGDIYTAAPDGSDVRLLVGGSLMEIMPSWGK
jgi:Tol biopolymer transport system component